MFSMPPASTTSASPSAICCAASWTVFIPEPHAILTLYAATSIGTPERTLTWRPVLGPFPAWRACPRMVWSICSGAMSARRIASFAASVPSSTAGVSAKEPRNLPIGVRAPSMMTAVSIGGVYRPPFGRPPGVRPTSRIALRIRASAAPPSTGSDGATSHRSTWVG